MINKIYQHYKNKDFYQVIALAIAELDSEKTVVYRKLLSPELVVCRPFIEFVEILSDKKGNKFPRFKEITNFNGDKKNL